MSQGEQRRGGLWREIAGGWDRFWFTPTDPATLGLLRILAGAMLLYTHLVWSIDLPAFFGDRGWLAPSAVAQLQANGYAFSYFWWLHEPWQLWAAHAAALVAFAMLTLGLCTRASAVVALVATLSYVQRARGALFGLDQVNTMMALYLAVGPAGDAYSLDRWRARRRGRAGGAIVLSVGANVAIRLMQIHMCVIYMFAGMAKLVGRAWWDGTAMWLAFANLEYQSLDMTWLARHAWITDFLTHVTIFWEVYYCALIWPRQLRPIMLALCVPVHLGIAMCLGMVTFGLAMIFGNMAFLPPHVVRGTIDRIFGRRSNGAGQGGAATFDSLHAGSARRRNNGDRARSRPQG